MAKGDLAVGKKVKRGQQHENVAPAGNFFVLLVSTFLRGQKNGPLRGPKRDPPKEKRKERRERWERAADPKGY